MAWTYFPVSAGRLTADTLNELRAACAERGISAPGLVSRGFSTRTLGTWVTAMRTAITTAVGSPGPYGYWEGNDWYTLTVGATAGTSMNLFEYAFGSGSTWPHAVPGSTRGLVVVLNDIYTVLNKIQFYRVSTFTPVVGGVAEVRFGAASGSCSTAVTNTASATWSSGGSQKLHVVSLNDSSGAIRCYQNRTMRSRQITTPPFARAIKAWAYTSGLTYFRTSQGVYYDLARSLSIDLRCFSDPLIGFAQGRTGVSILSFDAVGHKTTGGTLAVSGDIDLPSAWMTYMFILPGESCDSPVGSGVCDYFTPAMPLDNSSEEVTIGDIGVFIDWIAFQMKLEKLAA
jgi:hypothetical protein